MLTLTKLIGMLLMPLGLLWLGLLAATLWAFRKRARGLGAFLALLTLGLSLAGNPLVGHLLKARLERGLPSLPDHAPPLEALYVLGGGSDLDEHGHPILGEYGDRLLEAARLWHAGRVKRLVAGGASHEADGRLRDFGQESRVIWMELGVPEDAIQVIGEPCFITRDEIQAFQRLKAQKRWTRVGLLSSAWHLPRVLALAGREGLDALPLRSKRPSRIPPFRLWQVVPQEEGIRGTQQVCWEVLGRWAGR
ncbi:membrane protein [Geothrix limicola]|uniref:Membrane protein n=1 Tax=Geothrix limicola TaxID=2927978 RepID=A0ABQ5QEY1_9BACT|nr:YdcF family protein [Geothrix limicola]GLH72896.1 membrane protein [Geothrix limicola]